MGGLPLQRAGAQEAKAGATQGAAAPYRGRGLGSAAQLLETNPGLLVKGP